MRFLVTGGRGQLGSTLATLDERGGHAIVSLGREAFDVTDAASVRAAIEAHRPHVVINCAAWTRVDDAEVEREAAWRLNADAAGIVATECARAEVLCQHISTDYVFDGTATTPIPESATPSPVSEYGRSKLAGEQAVRAAGGRWQIVRTSWLFGGHGPNFVLTMLRLAGEGRIPRVVGDQVGAPTWTGHLAPALLRLAVIGETGVVHLTNSKSTTWWGLANAVLLAARSEVRAERITTEEYPTRARRPAYSVLEPAVWKRLGERPLPAWQQGVVTYVGGHHETAPRTSGG